MFIILRGKVALTLPIEEKSNDELIMMSSTVSNIKKSASVVNRIKKLRTTSQSGMSNINEKSAASLHRK